MTISDDTLVLPPDEDQVERERHRRHRKVTVRRWVLVLGVVVGVLLVGWVAWSQYEDNKKTDALLDAQAQLKTITLRFHAANVRSQHQILALEHERSVVANQILALQMQTQLLTMQIHAEVPAITSGLNAGQNTLITQYNTVVTKQNGLCAALISIRPSAASFCNPNTPLSPLQPNPLPTTVPTTRPAAVTPAATTTTTTTTTTQPRPPTSTAQVPPTTTTTTRKGKGHHPHP